MWVRVMAGISPTRLQAILACLLELMGSFVQTISLDRNAHQGRDQLVFHGQPGTGGQFGGDELPFIDHPQPFPQESFVVLPNEDLKSTIKAVAEVEELSRGGGGGVQPVVQGWADRFGAPP